MTASGTGQQMIPANGWNRRLYWLWIWYNTLAFVTVLTVGLLLSLLNSDLLHLDLASSRVVVALLVATLGAALFGGVLGALQWLVVRERVPIPRKVWITANIGPALLAWLLVIMPAVIDAQNSNENASAAYLLAASQALDPGGQRRLPRTRGPAGKEGNWIQTDPDKGFFTILRLYRPLKSFFDRTWRPSEIENYQDK
jgi:hypothetical protein